jgi:predicted dithiol-disulfide oxidoreductase (DUF899 family)
MEKPFWERLKSITLHVPGEPQRAWPENASAEYVAARHELGKAEAALRDQVEAVAELRRALPPGPPIGDYELLEGPRDLSLDEPVQRTKLRDLFGDHDELIVYHLMFHPDDDEACPMCSLWVDGLHGVSHHIVRHASFVVIGKAPLPKLRAWARRRGWDGLRILSSYETTFNADMGVEGSKGGQMATASVFVRDRDEVRHSVSSHPDIVGSSTRNRGIDLLSPIWGAFDLLPGGRGDWLAENDYPGRARG